MKNPYHLFGKFDIDQHYVVNWNSFFNFRTQMRYRIPHANDISAMQVHESMREEGMKPAQRVALDTEAYEFSARLHDKF